MDSRVPLCLVGDSPFDHAVTNQQKKTTLSLMAELLWICFLVVLNERVLFAHVWMPIAAEVCMRHIYSEVLSQIDLPETDYIDSVSLMQVGPPPDDLVSSYIREITRASMPVIDHGTTHETNLEDGSPIYVMCTLTSNCLELL